MNIRATKIEARSALGQSGGQRQAESVVDHGPESVRLTQLRSFMSGAPCQRVVTDDNNGLSIATPTPVVQWGTMKRHHVIPRAKLRDFAEQATTSKDRLKAVKQWTDVSADTFINPGKIGLKDDEGKAARLRIPIGVTAGTMKTKWADSYAPAKRDADNIDAMSTALQWAPGNIVPGPANRSDDPPHMDDLDEALLKITGSEDDFKTSYKGITTANIFDKANKDKLQDTVKGLQKIYRITQQRVPELDRWEKKQNLWKVR